MRTIRLKLSEIPKNTINLGFCGENNNTRVLFDCTGEIVPGEEYFVYMSIERPTGEKEGVVLTLSDGLAEWIITSADLTAQFYGEYQITLKHGEDAAKTAIGHYVVNRSVVVNPEPEPPATGLTGRTFMFNETIDFDFGEICTQMTIMNCIDPSDIQAGFNVLFTEQSTGKESVEESVYGLTCIKQQGQVGVFYLLDPDAQSTLVYTSESGWSNQDLRTIRFVSDANVPTGFFPPNLRVLTTEEVLAWLAENAEEIIEGGN